MITQSLFCNRSAHLSSKNMLQLSLCQADPRMMRDTQAPAQASPAGASSSCASLTVLTYGRKRGGLCSQYSVRFLLSTQFLSSGLAQKLKPAEPVRLFLSLRGASVSAVLVFGHGDTAQFSLEIWDPKTLLTGGSGLFPLPRWTPGCPRLRSPSMRAPSSSRPGSMGRAGSPHWTGTRAQFCRAQGSRASSGSRCQGAETVSTLSLGSDRYLSLVRLLGHQLLGLLDSLGALFLFLLLVILLVLMWRLLRG